MSIHVSKKVSIRPIAITLGFIALAILPQSGQAGEDRCAALDSYGHPIHCSPAGEGLAPVWDDIACCRGSDCTLPNVQGQCSTGRTAYWCEFAELATTGALTCLFEVPDLCEATECMPSYDDGDNDGEPMILCCPWDDFDDCYEYWPGAGCDTVWYCDWGASNDDGTYSCYEPEPW
jgi:hypothetical protein